MARVEPLNLMEDSIREEMMLVDDDRGIINLGGSFGVTIPPAIRNNEELSHGDEFEVHYDPSTGAIVLLRSDEDDDENHVE